MEFLVLSICGILLFINWRIYRDIRTSFSLIILPYIIIYLVNNLFMFKFGFIKINSDVAWMLIGGMLFFWIGNLIYLRVSASKNGNYVSYNANGIEGTKEAKIQIGLIYIYFVLLIRIFQLVLRFRQFGLSEMIKNDFELFLTRGFVSHLVLSIFPLMPLIFYRWLQHKNERMLIIAYLIFALLAFIETEKAQIISLIIATFLYCCFKQKKYMKKGLLIIFSIIAFVFIGNYVIKLSLQGYVRGVAREYYYFRLWNYIAGGLITSNRYISQKMFYFNAIDYMGAIVLAVPNMLSNRILGWTINPMGDSANLNRFFYVTYQYTGFTAQTGNTVSTMTMAYGNGNGIAFFFFQILWGLLSEYLLGRLNKKRSETEFLVSCCYMTFSLLSFFGSYYTIASFTERLIYAWVIGKLIDGKVRLKIGSRTGITLGRR